MRLKSTTAHHIPLKAQAGWLSNKFMGKQLGPSSINSPDLFTHNSVAAIGPSTGNMQSYR